MILLHYVLWTIAASLVAVEIPLPRIQIRFAYANDLGKTHSLLGRPMPIGSKLLAMVNFPIGSTGFC